MNVKISVLTPVYNGEQYIETCIKSIINSDYDLALVEHIIIDDGSSDNTKKICEEWAKKYNHIKFYSKANGNWGSVINYAKKHQLLHGDYTIVLDSDDQVTPNAFKLVAKQNDNCDILVGDLVFFNGKRKTARIASLMFPFKKLFLKQTEKDYFHHGFLPCCVYFKTDLFYKIRDLKEGLIYQDCILFSELELLSTKIRHIKHTLGIYWNVRVGNTVTAGKSERVINSYLSNLKYFETNDLLDPFVTYFLYGPPTRKFIYEYCSENNITFNFKTQKLRLKSWPWYMRLIIKAKYKKSIKKFVRHLS